MSKKVLILAIGCSLHPWNEMTQTSLLSWDSIDVEGCETIYYFGQPVKENTDKFIYFPIDESYNTMGYKMLAAFEWVLANKEFDYIARVNSSCYVNKKRLIEYVEKLPTENLFAGGVVAASENSPQWMWGGLQFIISKDVIDKIVAGKEHWNHNVMEDVALSYLVTKLGILYTSSKGSCSIDRMDNVWNLISYGGESISFTDFNDVKKLGHHFYRCKNDADRNVDRFVMQELANVLR